MAQIQFDATQVAPAQPRTPLPNGWFPVIITASEIKPTKDGSGTRLNFTFSVCQGHPRENRKVVEGLNIANPNPVAQQIAQEQLSAICHATGVVHLQDTNQLHGIPLLIKVTTVPERTDTVTGKIYEAKNEIKGYAKIGTEQVNMSDPKNDQSSGAAGAGPAWMQGAAAQPQPAAQFPSFAGVPQQQPAQVPAGEGPWGNAGANQTGGVPTGTPQQATPAAASVPVTHTPAPTSSPTPTTAPSTATPSSVATPAAEEMPAWLKPAGAAAPTEAAPAQTAPPAQAAPPAAAVPAWAQGAQG